MSTSKRCFRLCSINPIGDSPPIIQKYLPMGIYSGKSPETAASKIFFAIFAYINSDYDLSSDWEYDFQIKEVTRKSNKDIFYFRGLILESNRGGLKVFKSRSEQTNGSSIKSVRR